jgi:hypothetical protein
MLMWILVVATAAILAIWSAMAPGELEAFRSRGGGCVQEKPLSREDAMKSTTLLLSVATLSAGLITSGGTRAEDWKPVGQAGFLGVGKAYEIEKGHAYWVGEYGGTFFNDKGEKSLFDHAGIKCPAWADLDFNKKSGKFGGYCVITDLDGDSAYITWQGAGTPTRFPGTFDYTGGTGKYKDIKGTNTFVANTVVNWADATASGFATWNR